MADELGVQFEETETQSDCCSTKSWVEGTTKDHVAFLDMSPWNGQCYDT
jgi:hypothetical protein